MQVIGTLFSMTFNSERSAPKFVKELCSLLLWVEWKTYQLDAILFIVAHNNERFLIFQKLYIHWLKHILNMTSIL